MLNFSRFDSIMSLVENFPTEHSCKKFLAEQRWGKVVVCPYCGCTHVYTCKNDRYKCSECKNTFSVKVGTIFEDSNISLKKWFMAMYLVSSHKKGVSSCQLAKDIKVTQKSAWYILHKVRTLFSQNSDVQLEGEVELDEMYLGGKEKWKHASKHVEGTQGRSTKTKQPIFGMIERNGEARIVMVDNAQSKTLLPIIKRYVKEHTELFTDELEAYRKVVENGYSHNVVYHKANEYVNGKASTNCVEGFWSHFRRCIFGIYHHVSVKHLQSYIDEMVMRWNTRKASEGARFELMLSRSLKVVNYRDVVRKNDVPQGIVDMLNARVEHNSDAVVAVMPKMVG